MSASSLSTLQRSLVALTALHLQLCPLPQVLHLYCVTEIDLLHAYPEWERLQAERAAFAAQLPTLQMLTARL